MSLLLFAMPVFSACNKSTSDSQEAIELDSQAAIEHKEEENPPEEQLTNQQLEVTFIDVGQGDSTLISCNNHHMLIDGGNSNKSSTIFSVLNSRNISYLDYIIITHTDADHCGGVAGALNKAQVGTCYCSEKTDNTKAWNNVIKYLNQQNKSITVPSVGETIKLEDATITFLAPRAAGASDNNNSIVCRLDFGTTSFLFTGDAEKEEENELFSSGSNLDVDVLKVSHHGSGKCTSDAFLNKVTPVYSIISVGKNSYGHPGQDTINRLQSHNSLVYRTDKSGDITITSDGKQLNIRCSKG